ncbi:MAG: TIGR01212 family radical SAM protein [Bacteroidales bacterium]|nr:TIGR01212 family radical SAM protein [Bacteroidales bacterium]MBP5796128.1 TIGR01212 family radical SAM protein [Bacteroidales bacterium]
MEKRYNSYVDHFRAKYGDRLQKLVLDAGFTCPNRDGTVGTGGCTYCDNAAFHPGYSTPDKPISLQIEEGIEFHKVRYPRTSRYLAYFQAYSNTYAPLERLRELYSQALAHPAVEGIVVGTRPDCVDEAKLDYLASLQEAGNVVVVEYGIESCYDATLLRINRGHDFDCARRAVGMTAERGLEVGAHFILGLPGESPQMLLDQCAAINALPLTSVKFHQLQLIKGTAMEKEYEKSPQDFWRPGLDEYLDLIVDILERLRPDLCIERIAGEVPPRFVRQTPWGLVRNFQILSMMEARLGSRDTFQGRLFK